MSYSLHRSAERDLTDAFRFYKAEAGRGVAGRFLKEFERVVKFLEEFPNIGTPTNDERRAYPLSGFPWSHEMLPRCKGSSIHSWSVKRSYRPTELRRREELLPRGRRA